MASGPAFRIRTRRGKPAALFPAARFIVQPGAGYYPWLDDAGRFVSSVTEFLNDGPERALRESAGARTR